MTIHATYPFGVPEPARDPARRFRGRLVAPVTLWACGAGASRAGLTVSSVLIVLGEPASVLGLVDPDSDLADALAPGSAFTVTILKSSELGLSEAFAGRAPAPGGPFAAASFAETAWGPVPAGAHTWLGARVVDARPIGWSREIHATVEQVSLTEFDPLVHLRGRYRRLEA